MGGVNNETTYNAQTDNRLWVSPGRTDNRFFGMGAWVDEILNRWMDGKKFTTLGIQTMTDKRTACIVKMKMPSQSLTIRLT